MKAKQLYIVLIVLLVLSLGGLVSVGYFTNKVLSGRADTLSKLRADSAALGTKQASLAKEKQEVVRYSQLNQIAASVVPQDKNQAEAVREINNLANQSGIALTSVTFPASTLGSGSSKNTDLTQLSPVKGVGGVYTLQITVTQSDGVSYNQLLTFLRKLEQNRRTSQIANLSIQPAKNPNQIMFTLILNEYIKP